MITAAIIGPGNLITATYAGSNFGFQLLWVIVFSIFATAALQDMAARLGLSTHQGLSENISNLSSHPGAKRILVFFVILSLAFGNIAFIASSNIGIAISLQLLNVPCSLSLLILLGGLVTIIIPLVGVKKTVQPLLIGLIALMGLSFLVAILIQPPDITELFKGLRPNIPDNSLFTIVALTGSTLFPYSLFINARATAQKWSDQYPSSTVLRCSRLDTITSVGIAGLLMIAILSTATATFYQSSIPMKSIDDVAIQLEPALGQQAHTCFAIGLLAAALLTAITCPLGTAIAICGILKTSNQDMDSIAFKSIWIAAIVAGIVIALITNADYISIIMVTQAINGVLLPVIGLLLFITINKTNCKQNYQNCWIANLASALIITITFALAAAYIFHLLTIETG